MSYDFRSKAQGARGRSGRPRAASERTKRKRIEERRTHVLHVRGSDGLWRKAPLNLAISASAAAARGEVITLPKKQRKEGKKP